MVVSSPSISPRASWGKDLCEARVPASVSSVVEECTADSTAVMKLANNIKVMALRPTGTAFAARSLFGVRIQACGPQDRGAKFIAPESCIANFLGAGFLTVLFLFLKKVAPILRLANGRGQESLLRQTTSDSLLFPLRPFFPSFLLPSPGPCQRLQYQASAKLAVLEEINTKLRSFPDLSSPCPHSTRQHPVSHLPSQRPPHCVHATFHSFFFIVQSLLSPLRHTRMPFISILLRLFHWCPCIVCPR